MATFTPDPTFYPTARMAMAAPREDLAYVAVINPNGRNRPLAPMSHPRWIGMRVTSRELTVWSFLMATALITTGAAFSTGMTPVGYALSLAMVLAAGVLVTTGFCVPSFAYGLLFGKPDATAPAPAPPRTGSAGKDVGGRDATRWSP